jgi:hypothetical protein
LIDKKSQETEKMLRKQIVSVGVQVKRRGRRREKNAPATNFFFRRSSTVLSQCFTFRLKKNVTILIYGVA